MSVLRLIEASVGYRERPVLRQVTADVQPGDFVAIIGGNGVGKSTLLDVIAGDRAATSGRVELGGRPMSSWTPAELARRRAYLTQQTRIDFDFGVRDVVGFGLSQPDPVSIDAAIELAGITALSDRLVTRLSGGERRRVHFARLLAQVREFGGADLVLLDEPTAALDPSHAQHLLTTCRQLTAAGTAVVAVLHDLNLASAYADRIWLLHDGRLLADGPPAEVLTADRLERAFGIRTHILPHPDHGRPLVAVTSPTSPTGE